MIILIIWVELRTSFLKLLAILAQVHYNNLRNKQQYLKVLFKKKKPRNLKLQRVRLLKLEHCVENIIIIFF
jgi:hypothetical protein